MFHLGVCQVKQYAYNVSIIDSMESDKARPYLIVKRPATSSEQSDENPLCPIQNHY